MGASVMCVAPPETRSRMRALRGANSNRVGRLHRRKTCGLPVMSRGRRKCPLAAGFQTLHLGGKLRVFVRFSDQNRGSPSFRPPTFQGGRKKLPPFPINWNCMTKSGAYPTHAALGRNAYSRSLLTGTLAASDGGLRAI